MKNILKKFGPLSNFEFNKLFVGEIFSHFSDGTVQFIIIAILLEALPKAGSAMATLLFTFMLPQLLISPFAGALTDKFSRKWILSISAFYRFLLIICTIVILYAVNLSINTIYVISFLLGIGAAFFYTAKMSILPSIVKSADLKVANAINSAIGSVALLFGALLSKFFITKFGPEKSIIIISLMYLSASIILATLKLKEHNVQTIDNKNIFVNIAIAAKYFIKHKRALSLIFLALCTYFIVAIFSNTLNSLVTDYYKLGFVALTNIRTMLGISIIAGMGITLILAKYIKIIHLFAGAYITISILLLTVPFCHNIYAAWLWLLPIGIADAIVVVMVDTILQKITPNRLRGKIFGFKLTFTTLTFLCGTILVANIIGSVNPLNIFKVVAILTIILALCIISVGNYYNNLFKKRLQNNQYVSV